MKTKLLGMIAAFMLALTGGAAKADLFYVNATGYSQYGTGTISGTFSVTNGVVALSANLNATVPPNIDVYSMWGPAHITDAWTFGPPTAGTWTLIGEDLLLGMGQSLWLTLAGNRLGYTGGEILSGQWYSNIERCYITDCSYFNVPFNLVSGTVTLIPSPTPLPTALPLFATGLGALAFVLRRRR